MHRVFLYVLILCGAACDRGVPDPSLPRDPAVRAVAALQRPRPTMQSATAPRSTVIVPYDTTELRARADSLRHLDPVREARAALARGDERYLAACGRECIAIGLDADTVCLAANCALAAKEAHAVPGAEQPAVNEVARQFLSVAKAYGARYNEIVHAVRSHRERPRPVT